MLNFPFTRIIAKKSGLSSDEVEKINNSASEIIAEAASKDSTISIPGIGNFHVKVLTRPSNKGKSAKPNTYIKVKYRASRKLFKKINNKGGTVPPNSGFEDGLGGGSRDNHSKKGGGPGGKKE
ncbi:MAG: HU family DNA-binding protein [Deltaproteobacteria bacterium]|jgi:nucleoid DNA-binding protein|nr:HU family DNA-binding protein [Deltaproteobacteria bacterium]